ncbi:hypothetical protein HGRIS_008794 [Hohenbuehelia grisea]|uniref:PWWP domain-containing protein n=1 Tax=Hohenbuehelia grisea TaxID=104357 RepID=A0ABR3J9D5_9AGAR
MSSINRSPSDILAFLSPPSASPTRPKHLSARQIEKQPDRGSASSGATIMYIGRHPSLLGKRYRSLSRSPAAESSKSSIPESQHTSDLVQSDDDYINAILRVRSSPRKSMTVISREQSIRASLDPTDIIDVDADRPITRSQLAGPSLQVEPVTRSQVARAFPFKHERSTPLPKTSPKPRSPTPIKRERISKAPLPRTPMNGTIVWGKVDTYPWWPAIINMESLPPNILAKRGEAQDKYFTSFEDIFAVQFFDKSSDWCVFSVA